MPETVRKPSRRPPSASGILLGLLFLTSCAQAQGARLHLPEPSLPTCLVELPAKEEAVGRYEFAPEWLRRLAVNFEADQKSATRQALVCASDVAKSLREAVGTIRINNRP